jgi:DNA-binding NarL/FixJ family response regulator
MLRPRVLLADDHRLLREAFAQLLQPRCDVVGAVADGPALLDAAPGLRPDIVVLDIAMPLLNGLDAARLLREQMPGVKVIFLTVSEDPDLVAEVFRAAPQRLHHTNRPRTLVCRDCRMDGGARAKA